MSTQTLYEQYPQAVEWILKLLRNSTPPSQLAAEVDPIKEQIRGYLGAQVGLNSLFSQPPATTPQHSGIWNRPTAAESSVRHTTTSCPTCGQQARIDASSEKCGVCQKPMVVRHNRLNGQAFLGCTGYPSCRGTRNLSNLLLQRAREAIARATVAGGEELRRIEL